jgi:MYXO-CTERM domain-containing protein
MSRLRATLMLALALSCAPRPSVLESRQPLITGAPVMAQVDSPEPADSGRFGAALAMSGDALVVGQPWTKSTWLFTPADGGWEASRKLSEAKNGFGLTVAATADEVVVGAPGHSFDGETGAIYVYAKAEEGEPQILTGGYDFGRALSLRGDLLLVGGGEEWGSTTELGSAYLYRREAAGWQLAQELHPGEPELHRDLGRVVSLSDTVAAVGAVSAATNAPEILLFELDAGTWQETHTLTSADASSWGTSVVLDDSHVFVGEPEGGSSLWGAVHVFSRASDWEETGTIESELPAWHFGASLALSKQALSVGAHGAAVVSGRAGEELTELERLTLGPDFDADVTALAASNGVVALGLPASAAANLPEAGAVFVFSPCGAGAECEAPSYCADDRRCHEPKADAAECQRDGECASGHCADGVCCNSSCQLSCEACAEPDHVGRCVAISGTPKPGHESCAGDDPCGGSCDGKSRSCSYPPEQTPCGGECTDGLQTSFACDGAGSCKQESSRSCGNFACGDDACLGVCESNDDCIGETLCVSGNCVELSAPTCAEDLSASLGPLGSRACGAYRCDVASGACLSACSRSSQCAEGNVCDTATRNCVTELPPTPDNSGCSCRSSGRAPASAPVLALSIGALLFRRRKRWAGLALGASLVACGQEVPPAEQPGTSAAAIERDAVWVKGRTLSSGLAFADSLSGSGSTLLVGADRVAEWFVVGEAGWRRLQTIERPLGEDGTCRDWRVALDGDSALIGSYYGARSFERGSDGLFHERARLLTDVPSALSSMGCIIALRGDHAAMSDGELTVVFERDGDGWTQLSSVPGELMALTSERTFVQRYRPETFDYVLDVYSGFSVPLPLETTLTGKADDGWFGYGVVADDVSVIVRGYGALYAYDATDLAAPPGMLRPADEVPRPSFGAALALADDVLLVGDPGAERAEAHRGSGRDWQRSFMVDGPKDVSGGWGQFGAAVTLANDELLVGAPDFFLGSMGPVGAVFVYGHCSEDDDCPEGHYCRRDRFCAPEKTLGESCAPDAEHDCLNDDCDVCASGYCVDGVCCESSCGAQCESCAEPGQAGSCLLISGEPRGLREACAGDAATCQGMCTGEERTCEYPSSAVACGSSCEDGHETPSSCNGRGQCLERSSHTCLGYACDEQVCGASCSDDAGCVSGFVCRDERCVADVRRRCSEDGTRSLTDEGAIPCGLYRCDEASGACREECAISADCVVGLVCDERHKTCVRPSANAEPDGGCGCRLARPRASSAASLLLGLSVLCWLARRRPAVAAS